MEFGRKPLSLLELCVRKAIDNVRYLGSVDGVEMDLLKRILPHCTLEQLTKIEEETKMDLSPVTDPLWKRFYQREFGQQHYNKVVERLKASEDTYTWCQLYMAREKRQKEAEDEMVEKFTKKIQAEKAEKQSKQIKLCTKVPPSSKRSFFGGSGPSSLSNCSYKSPLLKKAKMEADSRARLQSAIQKNTFARSSQPIRTTSFNGQPVRTTTIHRPNSTITSTKPIGQPVRTTTIHRPNSTITGTKPMGQPVRTTTIHRPNSTSTSTKAMGTDRQIHRPMDAKRQIHKPMGANGQIHKPMDANSQIHKPMGANSQIHKPMDANRQIHKPMGANSQIHKPMGANRQIQNCRPKF